MNKKIKIIFVDIDWTLLDHEKHDFDYDSLAALNKAQKNNILIYLCTARPYQSVYKTGIFNHLKPDGLICTNGAVGFINDEVVYSDNFPKETVNKIIEVCNKYNLTLELSTEKERYFTREKNECVDAFFASYAEVMPSIKENYDDVNVSAILLFSYENMDQTLKEEFPSNINIYRFTECAADVQLKPSSKGEGIQRILSLLNIDKEESMGIGDDYGDIPMFENVGISVAMGNGVQEAKDNATHITRPIKDSGVKAILKELELI